MPLHEGNFEAESRSTISGYLPLFGISQALAVTISLLTGIWIMNHRGGLSWQNRPDLEFNYHPLLMVIGLIVLYAEGILVYRTFRYESKMKLKLAHMTIQLVAFLCVIVALKAVFDSHNLATKPIPHLYSLHSWLGLITVTLFVFQFIGGFVTFLFPGAGVTVRSTYLSIHVFFGLAIFTMAIATALMGFTEKAIFAMKNYRDLPEEGILVNVIGILLVLLAICVTYLVINPSYKRRELNHDYMLLTKTKSDQ